jgi:hypothetical protein
MPQMFTPGQTPVPRRMLDVEGISSTLYEGKSIGTIRKLFRDRVLHVHDLGGKTGRTNLTEENSARVRIALCEYLRKNGWSTGDAGKAIAAACGDEDKVVQTLVDDGRALDEIYEALKAEILKGRR